VVRHLVLFRFNPETKDTDKQALRDGLSRLRTAISEIGRYEFGDDLELLDSNFDFAIMAEFANSTDFKTYAAHPRHVQLVTELVRPIIAERVAVQYEF